MPKNGLSEEIEKEVGQAEGKLFTHRSAFSRASVIQAFLGSAPQLTLQLYISTLQQHVTVSRGMSMFLFPCAFGTPNGEQNIRFILFPGKFVSMGIYSWVCVPVTKSKT